MSACETDWDNIARCAYVAFCEASRQRGMPRGVRLPQWQGLTSEERSPWRIAVVHALQTWLHCDFRTALLDEDILRDVAAVLVVGGRKGDPAKEVLRRAVALLPVRLIDRCVLDGGSAEIFPHWQE